MAKIEMHLRDGQRLGWVQMRNGKPYYGYSKWEATDGLPRRCGYGWTLVHHV